jgi:hypothetical protein
VTTSNTVYDTSRSRAVQSWSGSTATLIQNNNQQTPVQAPRFINLLGGVQPDLLKWNRWTATIGEDSAFPSYQTNKGDPVVFNPGDVVQHYGLGRTRFYRCLQANSEHEPPVEGDDTWELLIWEKGGHSQFVPPDDARLFEGSFYDNLDIGFPTNAKRPELNGFKVKDGAFSIGASHLVPNSTNHLQFKPQLTNSVWSNQASAWAVAETNWVFNAATNTLGFYRVLVDE